MRAIEQASASPLLQGVDVGAANGILVIISAGTNLTLEEIETMAEILASRTQGDSTIVVGTIVERQMVDELRLTLLVTWLGDGPTDHVSSVL